MMLCQLGSYVRLAGFFDLQNVLFVRDGFDLGLERFESGHDAKGYGGTAHMR